MTRVRVMTATDLHQARWMYQALGKAVHKHKPGVLALVGDFLDSGLPHPDLLSPEECASLLAALRCEVVFIRGNHEGDNSKPESGLFRDEDFDLIASGKVQNGNVGGGFFGHDLSLVGFDCLPLILGNAFLPLFSTATRAKEPTAPAVLEKASPVN